VPYYTAIDPHLGSRFYNEVARLLQEVCERPQAFRQFDPPVRRHFSHWFPYGLVYLKESDRLWILAVMHMKREPGYWKSRLE
jgi:hypothetical protein